MLKTSSAGRAFIRREEGERLAAYRDSVGVLTIGVGHTSAAGPPVVKAGTKITPEQSDAILAKDLAGVEASVNGLVRVDLNQNEFDALVSLVFNIGSSAFAMSTLLKALNAEDREKAAANFLVWNKGRVKGKLTVIRGLANRRERERQLFLTPAAHAFAAVSPSEIVDEGEVGSPDAFAPPEKPPSVVETAGAIAAGVNEHTASITKAVEAGRGAIDGVTKAGGTLTAAATSAAYLGVFNSLSPTVLVLGFGVLVLTVVAGYAAYRAFRKTFKAPQNAGPA